MRYVSLCKQSYAADGDTAALITSRLQAPGSTQSQAELLKHQAAEFYGHLALTAYGPCGR